MSKKNYPLYETTVFENFRIMTENAAAKFPDKIAVSYRKNPKDKEAINVTYTQMKEDIRHFGTKAVEMGLREKHVAIVGEATYAWVVAFFGLMSIGAVTVPIDKELPALEIADILRVSDSCAVFYGKTAAEKIDEERANIPGVKTFVAMTGDLIDGAVSIESMKEREGKDMVDIDAIIYCERDSHKGIIIGKKGAMLKKNASESRMSIERFLGCNANLQLWVKVKEDWRNRDGLLRNFGFTEQ